MLAFDQAGFGSRMGEFAPFYKRHPHWSLMGRMVEDTTRAVDALAADPAIDPARISVFEVDYTRLTNATQDWAVRWMNQILAPSPVLVRK